MMRFTFLWLAIVAMVFPPNTAFADSITLVAGGSNGKDGGPAKEAALGQPFGVGLDSQGNLYIADYSEHRVRMVDSKLYISGFSGVVRLLDLQSGIIDKVRGLPGGRSIAVDSQGNIYVGGGTTLRVRRPNGKIEILLDKKAAETGTLTIGDNTKHLALDADDHLLEPGRLEVVGVDQRATRRILRSIAST